MAQVRQTSFHGGEIAPGLYGRTDLPKRAFSLKTARNFILTPTGTAANRPGFRYCLPAQAEATAVRLRDFTFSTSQAYVLEFGHQYIRDLQNGAVVTTVTGTARHADVPHGRHRDGRHAPGEGVAVGRHSHLVHRR